MQRCGQRHEERTGKAGMRHARDHDHEHPADHEVGAGQDRPAPKEPAQSGGQHRQPRQKEKRSQGEMPAPQRRGAVVEVIERRDGADTEPQDKPKDHGPGTNDAGTHAPTSPVEASPGGQAPPGNTLSS